MDLWTGSYASEARNSGLLPSNLRQQGIPDNRLRPDRNRHCNVPVDRDHGHAAMLSIPLHLGQDHSRWPLFQRPRILPLGVLSEHSYRFGDACPTNPNDLEIEYFAREESRTHLWFLDGLHVSSGILAFSTPAWCQTNILASRLHTIWRAARCLHTATGTHQPHRTLAHLDATSIFINTVFFQMRTRLTRNLHSGFISSIVRFAIFFRVNAFGDPTWASVLLIIWTTVEPGMYLIAACIPSLRPLLLHVFPSTKTRHHPSNGISGDNTHKSGGPRFVMKPFSKGGVDGSLTSSSSKEGFSKLGAETDLESGSFQGVPNGKIGVRSDFRVERNIAYA